MFHRIIHLGMTTPAVVHREGDERVTGTTEIAEDVSFHAKGLCPTLFNGEKIGMAVAAVEFGEMLFM